MVLGSVRSHVFPHPLGCGEFGCGRGLTCTAVGAFGAEFRCDVKTGSATVSAVEFPGAGASELHACAVAVAAQGGLLCLAFLSHLVAVASE